LRAAIEISRIEIEPADSDGVGQRHFGQAPSTVVRPFCSTQVSVRDCVAVRTDKFRKNSIQHLCRNKLAVQCEGAFEFRSIQVKYKQPKVMACHLNPIDPKAKCREPPNLRRFIHKLEEQPMLQ
jgi:hypothetical protein